MNAPGGVKHGPLRIGERFLKYRLRGLLGTGGHAWVYHGHDEFLDVGVAIKILHRPGGVTNDMLRRGQGEAKLLYRLKHENIVNVLDAGITDDGLLYIVMELLQGDTLRQVLVKKGRLGVADALPLFAKIADGVEGAHAFGAIHRDLKPENIFVLPGAQPKILDFGIAKVVDAAGWTTEKDVIHGTVLYMSPEQLRGEKATARSDVYALGLMLFEALRGSHPLLLKNRSPTIKELSWMQLSVKPPRLDELDPGIPRYVARLVERMILKLAEHRPSSMNDCAQAMRTCMTRLAAGDAGGRDESGETPLNVVTDKIHDTDRVDAEPFDASITLPRLQAVAPPANVTAPIAPRLEERPPRSDGERTSANRVTVRPVTASVTPVPPRAIRRFDGEERRWMLKVLAASSIVGGAIGGAYVALEPPSGRLQSNLSPSVTVKGPSPATRVAGLEAPAAVATDAPAPPVAASAAPVPPLVTATRDVPAPSPGSSRPATVAAGVPRTPIALTKQPRPHETINTKRDELPLKDVGSGLSTATPAEKRSRLDLTVPILE